MKNKIFIFLFLVITSFPLLADMKVPSTLLTKTANTKKRSYLETNINKTVFGSLVLFYSRVISPADGARSLSYPTGSAYGYQAIRQEGILTGILLIGDRLFHEADQHYGAYIYLYGVKRYYDPIEDNVFWWKN